MPEMALPCGTGPHHGMPPPGLRLLAVLSQDGAEATETLWQVCAQLQRLGGPVLVLDGTSAESDGAPGLSDLLARAPGSAGGAALPALAGLDGASAPLAVLPALHGLAALARDAHRALHRAPRTALHPLQPLQALFRSGALVVLHAPVAALASPLLKDLPLSPLLLLQPGADGVLEGYRQLKLLALHTGLTATVACVVPPGDAKQQGQARDALQAVSACAVRHLGQRLRTLLLQGGDAAGLQRLARQWLQGAGTVAAVADAAWPAAPAPSHGRACLPAHAFAHAPLPSQGRAPSYFQPGH